MLEDGIEMDAEPEPEPEEIKEPVMKKKIIEYARRPEPSTSKLIPVKLSPKPTLTTTSTSGGTKLTGVKPPGQIVIIQGQKGRLLNQADTTTISSGHGFQLIKTADGSIIQIKNKNLQSSGGKSSA